MFSVASSCSDIFLQGYPPKHVLALGGIYVFLPNAGKHKLIGNFCLSTVDFYYYPCGAANACLARGKQPLLNSYHARDRTLVPIYEARYTP